MRALLLLAVPLAAACSDVGTREQLTVVVEADRTRALADQARLAEMQRALADAKEELVATRKDLTELREKLMQAGALSAEEMRRLEAREASLRARENASASTSASTSASASTSTSTPGATTAAPSASATAAPYVPGSPATSTTPTTATTAAASASMDVAAEIASLAALRAAKGLRADDVDGGPALQKRAEEALKAKRNDDAVAAVTELRAKTESTAVNGALIKKKYAKASARLDALQGDAKTQAKKLLGDANTKNAKGDAAGANAALNAVLDL